MLTFRLPVDIANRALDHIGADAIDQTLGFTEPSRNALICGRVYDKLRRAELQRNLWTFATREAVLRPVTTTTMLLVPSLYEADTTYFVGSIVSDDTGTWWQSFQPNNVGNDPQNTPAWQEYSGPSTVSLYDTSGTTAYQAGELVYTTPGDGTNRVYVSLINANSDVPGTATAWDATVTYFKNQIVTASSVAYMSLIDLNLNQNPATTFFAAWASGTTYAAGNKVTGSDGLVYQSIGSGNVGHDPVADAGVHWTNTGVLSPWTTSFVSGTGSLNWRQIGGAEFPTGVTLTPFNIIYPDGVGPSWQTTTKNLYRLPANFLRRAPQTQKQGAWSPLGAPGNPVADDWLFQRGYLITRCATPITLRFVADTVDVATFADMFCEGLAARIGIEVCEPLTQSRSKKATVQAEYQRFMGEARTSNAILVGPIEPPLDDWIACRA